MDIFIFFNLEKGWYELNSLHLGPFVFIIYMIKYEAYSL